MTAIKHYPHGQFSWIDYPAHNKAQAREFYCGLFDWKAEHQNTQGGPPYSVFSYQSKAVAGLGEAGDELKKSQEQPSWNHYINVNDIEKAVETAHTHGAEIRCKPTQLPGIGWMAMIADPTGAEVCFWQACPHIGAEARNTDNTVRWNELVTSDIEKARAFYGKVLGWQFRSKSRGAGRYYVATVNGRENCGLVEKTAEHGDMPSSWTVYFQVSDLDAACTKTNELGGKTQLGPHDLPSLGRVALLNDDQGGSFYLVQSP